LHNWLEGSKKYHNMLPSGSFGLPDCYRSHKQHRGNVVQEGGQGSSDETQGVHQRPHSSVCNLETTRHTLITHYSSCLCVLSLKTFRHSIRSSSY
jgi:hypothetical protein